MFYLNIEPKAVVAILLATWTWTRGTRSRGARRGARLVINNRTPHARWRNHWEAPIIEAVAWIVVYTFIPYLTHLQVDIYFKETFTS